MAVTLNASTTAGLVQTADTTGNLSLQSGGTTILALTSAGAAVTGTLSASGQTTLTGGVNLTSVVGTSYVEGTWTPSLGGNTTYSTQTGRYTKVGRTVFIVMRLTISAIGTGSASTISGLPFVNGATEAGFSLAYGASMANSAIAIYPRTNASASTITFVAMTASAATVSAFSPFGNSTDLILSGTYETI